MVLWLRPYSPSAGEARAQSLVKESSHASVKEVHMLGLQEFTAKTWHGQTNKYF